MGLFSQPGRFPEGLPFKNYSMKGERNRSRALKAKAQFGEGTERKTAQRILNKLEQVSKSSLPVIPKPQPNFNKGLSMNDLLNAYGDVFQDEPINYNVLVVISIIVILVFIVIFNL